MLGLYRFHDKIRIYFIYFIVQISPFQVHLLNLRLNSFSVGLCPGPDGGLKQPPDPSPQVVPTFHFIPSYAAVNSLHICTPFQNIAEF
jgi:hypothetical protein